MTDNLTQLIDKVQELLLDGSGTLFSSTTCTAAVRQALTDVNLRVPIHAATTITAIADQKEYELTDEPDAENAIRMTSLYLQGANEYDTVLDFDSYVEDERIFFRLRTPQPAGEIMLTQFTLPHTINGLDAATESTIPSVYDQVLVVGAAYHACIIRGAGVAEANTLDKATPDSYRELARHFNRLFEQGIKHMALRRPIRFEPDTRAWNDAWHAWPA